MCAHSGSGTLPDHMRSTDEIRRAYLDFFVQKHGHAEIPGASLIPENDPTVLFTTAGMHPLVPYLLGEKHPSGKRLVDCQCCVRTQDIDEVGDASHLTMFEMLGNWSLGEYFKEGAIRMSFEFLTSKEWLGIPVEKIAVTCFEGDSDAPKDTESEKIWMKMGVPKERIGFLPKAKNWWGPAGHTGPCGPDTEMFYWIGSLELPPAGSNPANDEKNWLEIWNDVFMQYNKQEDGTFAPLKQQNVDTGMGLERVAQVLQRKKSVYETDRMEPIVKKVKSLCKYPDLSNYKPLQRGKDAANIATDHLRAATFIIADGVKPSNVDQGYILRRLIRRAIVSARSMEMFTPEKFCAEVALEVIAQYSKAYPHLQTRSENIVRTLHEESKKFLNVVTKVLDNAFARFQFSHVMAPGQPYAEDLITAEEAFDLFTTHGLPLPIIKEEAEFKHIKFESDFEQKYKVLFEEHQVKSRAGAERRFAGGLADHSAETTKLHTATHLLNAALRKVLGPHVQQKGSNITAERLRFDFNHPEKMTTEQVKEVERLVNDQIRADLPVAYHLTTVEGAKTEGAIGVFDDRYATEVKVYVVGDGSFSKEICGGPHVARTGMIGTFNIQKEESSSAGIRRIRAMIEGGPAEISIARGAIQEYKTSHGSLPLRTHRRKKSR